MFLNQIKIAFRSLVKFKGYATINILGLALGLMSGILVMVYVLDEVSFDQFHVNKNRIYRVETSFFTPASGEEESSMDANGWAIGSKVKEFPEVESVVYIKSASGFLVNHGDKHVKQQMHFASPEFYQIFSFPFVEGDPRTALTHPYSIVISENMAHKYFKEESALNKTITLSDTLQFKVTGVMKDIPANSHIQTDAILSFETYTKLFPFDYNGGWGNINVRNYVLVKENVNIESLRAKARNIYMANAGESLKNWGVEAYVHFAPLKNLYLTAKGNGMGPLGSEDRLYLLSGIAGFVILLACINFINLTTARSVYRSKEVGLRKVVGSTRGLLIRQFLSESFVITCLSLFLAVTFAGLLLPLFNQVLGKNFQIGSLLNLPVISGMVLLVITVTLLSGYYPAIVMSAMKPVQVLKGKLHGGTSGVQLRRSLVVFQFTISVALVAGTFIVIDQLRFMQSQDLGFAKDEILVVNAARANAVNEQAYATFKNELSNLAVVESASYTNSVPGNPGWGGQVSYAEEKSADESISVEYMAIDENYLKTLKLNLIAGNNFSLERTAELHEGLIINEKAASMYGWASSAEAVGKRIASPSGYPAGIVIGVVKDYHQFGLKHEIGPMVMDYNPNSSYLYAVRYQGAATTELLTQTEALWKKHFPGYDFNFFFLDQDFERQYAAEQKLATVFGIFAAMTIAIAVIGLLGLVSFMIITRTKEIGVRKVLGADIISITSMLSKEFLLLVIIGNVIAIPVVWYLANQWLQNFATHNQLNPWLFVATLLVALGITGFTISFQTIRAALTDPAKALRYE
jgi:putative ABC transport system permease protein